MINSRWWYNGFVPDLRITISRPKIRIFQKIVWPSEGRCQKKRRENVAIFPKLGTLGTFLVFTKMFTLWVVLWFVEVGTLSRFVRFFFYRISTIVKHVLAPQNEFGMLKSTWSNYKRSGILVDPPSFFSKFPHFPFFLLTSLIHFFCRGGRLVAPEDLYAFCLL